jgi:hypothetical protein
MLTEKQMESLKAGDQVKYNGKTYIVKKTTRNGYVHVWDREHHFFYNSVYVRLHPNYLKIPAKREVYNIRNLDFTPDKHGQICNRIPTGECMNAYCVYCSSK